VISVFVRQSGTTASNQKVPAISGSSSLKKEEQLSNKKKILVDGRNPNTKLIHSKQRPRKSLTSGTIFSTDNALYFLVSPREIFDLRDIQALSHIFYNDSQPQQFCK
jgi:hypothetical protein